ncbi:hypothetical protein B0T16DRAFT_385872 [Cercophora newfieldiana]|uniref:Uncharacterized protein n=1 Tax=Cercophora newfieldiana TaxID=92897 RepID=A0AA39YSR9_9PEZI|nr:hypothetical protein B0T16DRAFT_385872 [Cercophora newfieldiana]
MPISPPTCPFPTPALPTEQNIVLMPRFSQKFMSTKPKPEKQLSEDTRLAESRAAMIRLVCETMQDCLMRSMGFAVPEAMVCWGQEVHQDVEQGKTRDKGSESLLHRAAAQHCLPHSAGITGSQRPLLKIPITFFSCISSAYPRLASRYDIAILAAP